MIEVLEAICGELRLSGVLSEYGMSGPMIINISEIAKPYGMNPPFITSWKSEYNHDMARETSKFIMKCSCMLTIACVDHEAIVRIMKSRYSAQRYKKIDLRDPESVNHIICEAFRMARDGTGGRK